MLRTKMNNKKIITKTKTMMKNSSTIIAAATIIAIVASYAMILGMRSEISQNALAQSYGSNGTTAESDSAVSVNSHVK